MLSGIDLNQFYFMSKKHVYTNGKSAFISFTIGRWEWGDGVFIFHWGASYSDGRGPQWCISKKYQVVTG